MLALHQLWLLLRKLLLLKLQLLLNLLSLEYRST
jgi:hypothetical protein